MSRNLFLVSQLLNQLAPPAGLLTQRRSMTRPLDRSTQFFAQLHFRARAGELVQVLLQRVALRSLCCCSAVVIRILRRNSLFALFLLPVHAPTRGRRDDLAPRLLIGRRAPC